MRLINEQRMGNRGMRRHDIPTISFPLLCSSCTELNSVLGGAGEGKIASSAELRGSWDISYPYRVFLLSMECQKENEGGAMKNVCRIPKCHSLACMHLLAVHCTHYTHSLV